MAKIKNEGQSTPTPEGVEAAKTVTQETLSTKEALADALFISRDIAYEAGQIAKEMGMSSIQASEFKKAFKGIADVSRQVSDNVTLIEKGQIKVGDVTKQIEKSVKAKVALDRESNQMLSVIASQTKGLSAAAQEELKTAKSSAEIQKVINKYSKDHINSKTGEMMARVKFNETQITALDLIGEQNDAQEQNAGILKDQLDKAGAINDRVGLTGKLMGGLAKIPIVGQFIKADEALQKMQEHAAEVDENGKLINSKFSTMKTGIMEVGKQIKSGMLDPLTIATALVKSGFAFDKQATEMQKRMAMSKTEAFALRTEITIAAGKSNDMAINGERVLKAFSTLQTQLGTTSTSLAGMAVDAAVMQEKLGLSDEAIGNAGKSSILLGKSMKNVKLDIIQGTTEIRSQYGVAVDYNEVLEETLNVSGQLRAQLGANPKEIAKAVAAAKSLGMELSQVADIGASLLDFESSIQNELEAELLTGKQLNLEKARLLALTGDYEELSAEIASQAGSFTEYSTMNVIQQNAIAKAFGMSADAMSDMLLNQEILGKTAEQLRAEGKEDLAQKLEARDAQQAFSDATEKLKGIFTDLVGGPVGMLLTLLTAALEPIGMMITGLTGIMALVTGGGKELSFWEASLGVIAGLFASIYAYQKSSMVLTKGKAAVEGIILGYKIAQQGAGAKEILTLGSSLGKSMAVAATKIFSTFSAIPFGLGIPLAIVTIAGMGALISSISKADDATFEGGGYGKRTLLEEGRITRFNDQDTIIAGTKLGRADDNINAPKGTLNMQPPPPPPAPIILKNEVVYDSYQSANYYNGPRSTEKSETGVHI